MLSLFGACFRYARSVAGSSIVVEAATKSGLQGEGVTVDHAKTEWVRRAIGSNSLDPTVQSRFYLRVSFCLPCRPDMGRWFTTAARNAFAVLQRGAFQSVGERQGDAARGVGFWKLPNGATGDPGREAE